MSAINAPLVRAACAGKPARAPPAVPFAFFEISPRRISFLAEKGLAGGAYIFGECQTLYLGIEGYIISINVLLISNKSTKINSNSSLSLLVRKFRPFRKVRESLDKTINYVDSMR